VSRWIWLGVRLSLGSGRAGWARTVLMASGAAVGTLVVLAALAGSSAYGKQHERDQARTPTFPDLAASSKSREPVTGLTFGGGYDAIGARQLIRVAVGGATPASPLAPGLRAYPGPGEAIVSPALADLIRTDERARNRFPQRVVGLIGQAGLLAPDELYAYVGVAADDPYLVGRPPVTSFRGPGPWTIGPGPGDAFTPQRLAGVFFALFVLVPFGVFLASCARLSASTRDRRIAALRLLGVSARQAALVNAIETGVVAGAGTLTGYALLRLMVPLSGSWHIGRLRWYTMDLTLPVPVVALVLAITVAYAVGVGVLATRPARLAPLHVRRDAPARRPTLWRLVPLAAGATLSIVAVRGTDTDPVPTYLAYPGALILVGLGVPLAVPLLTWTVAGLVGRRPGTGASWQLAAARLRHSPSVAPRLVASLAAAVYVAGIGSLGATLVTDDLRTRTAVAGANRGAGFYQTTVADAHLADDLVRAGGTIIRTTSLPVLVDGAMNGILMADCASITAGYRLGPGESCVDGGSYRIEIADQFDAGQPPLAAGAEVRDPDGQWSFPVPRALLHLTPKIGYITNATLLITPASPVFHGSPPAADDWVDVLAPDPATGERIVALISATTPANFVQGGDRPESGVDGALVGTLLAAGLAISVGMGVAAFAVAAADRTVERRRESTTLTVIGTPARVVAASEVTYAAIPLVTGLTLATGAVVGMTLVLADVMTVNLTAVVDVVRPALWLSGAACLAGLLLVAAPAVIPRRVTPETLRRS
jgi:hypothetical protein